jgi:hypothetical protein
MDQINVVFMAIALLKMVFLWYDVMVVFVFDA